MRLLCTVLSVVLIALTACGEPSGIRTVQSASETVDGRTLDDWAVSIRATDPRHQPATIRRLAEFGARALPLLASLLDSATARQSESIFRAVAAIGPKTDPDWATRAATALHTAASPVRAAAADALRSMGAGSLDAIDPLLSDADERIRARAVLVLATLPRDPALIARHCRLAMDEYWIVRRESARALAAPDVAPTDEVRHAIASLLTDTSPDVQVLACEAAASSIRTSTPLRTRTRALLDSPQGRVRGAAARTLGRVADVLPNLTERLAEMSRTDENVDARIGAALGHWRATGTLDAAEPALLAGLSHRHVRVRRLALRGIGLLGSDAGPLVIAVAARLQDRSVRVAAIEALTILGPAARPAVPALRQVRTAARPFTASRIDAALAQIGG